MTVISSDTKTAIILFNLGGPDATESVEPFLRNLFSDPAIIRLPECVRLPLAKFIARRRAPVATAIYDEMGGASPILKETKKQQRALTAALKESGNVKLFHCMRYWHPMSEEVVAKVKKYKPDHIILLPLYPQFSTTTTGSSFTDWEAEAKKQELDVPTTRICCYPTENYFIAAHADTIREYYFKVTGGQAPRVLFSAHGLPEKIIRAGDPYQWQVEQTVEKVVSLLGIAELDYVTCYQSRVGPLKWISPSTEEEIIRAGKDELPVVVVPIAFVSEHSETLVELDIEYKHLAEQNGVKEYHRVPALTAHTDYIETLKQICLSVGGKKDILPGKGARICPVDRSGCPCKHEE